jgi:NAD-dependent deacetylase
MKVIKAIEKKKIKRAAKLLLNAKEAIILTGAGVSTESGIPDFRGKGGIWEKYKPEIYGYIDAFLKNPARFWDFAQKVAPTLFKAKPNPGHIAIAELEKMGIIKAIITQNVDELHQKAGSIIVYEVHGNVNRFDCMGCKATYSKEQILKKIKREKKTGPSCDFCASPLKPSVVLFGESLPKFEIYMSQDLAKKADIMLIAGSSLMVAPVCDLPLYTLRDGGKLIIINDEPTNLDERAEVVFHQKTGIVLPLIVEQIKKLKAEQNSNT